MSTTPPLTGAADVRSIDALRDWLAAARNYHEICSESLSGIRLEIHRGLEWIDEQIDLWRREARNAEEGVVQAKAELAARKFPNWDGRMPDTTVQERNLRRAEARLEHAHDRAGRCKQWLVQLPRLVDETFTGAGHRLELFLEADLARALAALVRQIETLERYAGVRLDFGTSSTPTAVSAGEITKPKSDAEATS